MWDKIKQAVGYIWAEFCHIIHDVFVAEEQQIMTQLFTMLKNDAVALQNSQPGISSKDMENVLKNNATAALAGLGASLAYTAIVTVIGTVMHDLQVPDNTGNAGAVVKGS